MSLSETKCAECGRFLYECEGKHDYVTETNLLESPIIGEGKDARILDFSMTGLRQSMMNLGIEARRYIDQSPEHTEERCHQAVMKFKDLIEQLYAMSDDNAAELITFILATKTLISNREEANKAINALNASAIKIYKMLETEEVKKREESEKSAEKMNDIGFPDNIM